MKVAGVVGAPGANFRMGGHRLGSNAFNDAVEDAVKGVLKGTPPVPCPLPLETAFWDAVANGGDQADLFEELLGEMQKPPFAGAICAWAGLPPGAVAVIPKKREKVSAIVSGTATHMMRNTAYVLHDGKVIFKYNKRGDFHESIGDNNTVFIPGTGLGKTNPIFGVTFGLEICLDHDIGVLHTDVSGSLPDLHIVLSDSVDNVTAHMKAKHYYLHASTAANRTGVWGPAPNWNEATSAKLAETDPADGGTISYWKLAIQP